VDDAGDQPIGFTTYSIREVTKAGDMGEGDSFNVAAYYTSGTEELYFESQLFTYSTPSSCFISSPVRYWPNIGALDFYAVSPATLTADKTVPSFTADGHTDFTAVCLSNQKRPSSTGDSPLLNFGHKLAKVAFKAIGSDTNLKYVISSATLTAGSVAAYTFDKLGDGSWTVASTSKTYTAASSKTIGYNTSGTVSFGDPLFLIPSQGTAAETVNLSLSYKVYQKDSKGGDHLVYSCTKSVDLTASAQTDWGINKSVLYSLTLPASDASHVISFTSSVSDWDDDIEISIKYVSSITVSPVSVPELAIANNVTLTATVLPADASLNTVVWSSSDTLIATVNPSTGVVTGVAPGTVTITATAQDGSGVTGTRQVTVVNPEVVDLGLSVKWATWNIGASLPQEYGDYYAWGETETKSEYSWSTYKWCNGSATTLTKYCTDSSSGTTDYKKVLDPEDDVAHVKWGGSWRMPTADEWKELCDNCTWTWTTVGGVNGSLVTSKKAGYTDKSIFLPATGRRGVKGLDYVGSDGFYWSSSLNTTWPYYASRCTFNSGSVGPWGYHDRSFGNTVRPVTE